MTEILRAWAERRTHRARVSFEPDSYAAARIEQWCARIDAAYERAWEWIGSPAAPPEVSLYLAAWMPNTRDLGWIRLPGALVAPDDPTVWLLVSPESPGLGLEYALFYVLLRAAGQPLAEQGQEVVRSLAGFAAALHEGEPTLGRADREAFERIDAGREPPTLFHQQEVGWAGRTPPTATADELSFLRFLLQAHGSIALGNFARAALAEGVAAAAPRAYARSFDDLQTAWRTDLRRKNRAPATILYLLKQSAELLRPYRVQVVLVLIFMVLDLLLNNGVTLSSKFLFDVVIPSRDPSMLGVLLGLVLAAYVLQTIIGYGRETLSGRISELVLRDSRIGMFSHLQELSARFHLTSSTGDLLARMTYDLDRVQDTLSATLPALINNLLMFAIAVAMLLFLNWQLAMFVLFIGLPALLLVNIRASERIRDLNRELSEQIGGVSSVVEENLAVQMLVKIFSLERQQIEFFTGRAAQLYETAMRAIRFSAVLSRVSGSILFGIQGFILAVGSLLIMSDRMSIGDLFAFMALVSGVIAPAMSLSGQFNHLVAMTGSFDRVQEVLREQPDVVEDPNAGELPPLKDEIRIENLTFAYGDNDPSLSNLSLRIQNGERVAIVGGSGAGKSTVIGLLLRLYDPNQGRILFDGRDVRTATIQSLRRQLAVVPQDSFLFNTTVRENIALGREGATDEEIVRAAKAAAIHDLIEQLEDGYETMIGERGARLSGGQRQRVAIARALIRDPRVLILDEATSALDAQTEAAVLHTLEEAGRGRTTIMITHRIAAAAQCDRIMVLDHGRLVEEGTHDQLRQRRGVYWQLYAEQQGGGAEPTSAVLVPAQRLADVPLFASLDAAELGAIVPRVAVERYPAGRVIVRQGEAADRLFIVAEGQVEVLVGDSQGQRLRTLGPRNYFGEIALLGAADARRTATVRAVTDVEVFTLHKEDFLGLLQAHPRLAQAVDRLAQDRLQRSDDVARREAPPVSRPSAS